MTIIWQIMIKNVTIKSIESVMIYYSNFSRIRFSFITLSNLNILSILAVFKILSNWGALAKALDISEFPATLLSSMAYTETLCKAAKIQV